MRSLFLLSLILPFAFGLASCMKPHKNAIKTKNLEPHFLVSKYTSYVYCDAYFYDITDPSAGPIALEDDALLTCEDQPMYQSNGFYSRSLTYEPGKVYTIKVIRPVDGSTIISSTQID